MGSSECYGELAPIEIRGLTPLGSPAAQEGPALVDSSSQGCSRVLVVDDSVDTVRGMEILLKHFGYAVETAGDGLGAIDVARRQRPHFVLLDIGLPGIDGYETACRLKREESCQGSVLVAISGYGRDEDRRRSREVGFDHHFIKPVDYPALFSLLATPTN
jgi:CheY-like chemotaxis protein